MATDWAKIGNALTGFGAGLTGQGPQWQAMQAQNQIAQQNQQLRQREYDRLEAAQQRELDKERRIAFFSDMMGVGDLIRQGKLQEAKMVTEYRLKAAPELGAPDVEESQMLDDLLKMAMAGDQNALKMAVDFTQSMGDFGMAIGAIPRPQSKVLGSSDIVNGQVVTMGPDGRPVATAVEGFQAPAQERKTAVVNGVLVDTQTGAPIYEAPREQPEAFRALEARAQAAGMQQGTPEYRQFMASNGAGAEDLSKGAGELRREFASLPQVKEFSSQATAFGRIAASAQSPDAAGDLALIFNYMKMLDPGSTVREGEFANAQNAAGVPQQVRNLYQRVLEGVRLAPEQREQFLSRAEKIYKDAERGYTRLQDQYKGLAARRGLPEDEVVIDFRYYDGSEIERDNDPLGLLTP